MKRIAYVVHSLNLGGAERLAVDMALALARDYELCVVCLDEVGLWADSVRDKHIPVHCMYRQPGIDLGVPLALARFARTHGIDLWHTHQATPWFYAGLSRLVYPGAKLLFEEHGRHYPEILSLKRIRLNRWVLQPLTHAVVAVSRDIQKRLVLYEGLNHNRIQVISNGAPIPPPVTQEQRRELRRKAGIQEQDFLLGTVGRFDAIKNLPLALEAVAEVARKHPRLKCLLVGDGPEHAKVQQEVARLGLQDRVLLPGYQDDPATWTALLDCFFLVSFSEGTSMALLGAMAAGIPAIVTDVGGNPELVHHGRTGWVVPSGDGQGLSAAITEAVSTPEQCQVLGHAARLRFNSFFTFEAMLAQYRDLYAALLG